MVCLKNYLHYILDLWFERVVKRQLSGYAKLIRYSDDFIVCFQRGDETETLGEMLKQRLDKFGLKVDEGKSGSSSLAEKSGRRRGEKAGEWRLLIFWDLRITAIRPGEVNSN